MRASEVCASATALSLTVLARLSWMQMSRMAAASWSAALLTAWVSSRVASIMPATSRELVRSSPAVPRRRSTTVFTSCSNRLAT